MADAPVRVLLIEDNPGDARLLREVLSGAGATVRLAHASRLADGIAHLSRESADVVLADLGLPDSQGLDTVRQIRQAAPDVAVVVLTGLDDGEVAVRALREGAQDYLTKGEIDGAILTRTIRHAIERHRMQTALRSLALVDDLTGLYNRRGFFALAEHHQQLARRTGKPYVLVFTDLDGLKAINDARGHQEGDRAIAELAGALRESCRMSDIVGRLGGDEFCALLVDATADVADLIRRRLEARLGARPAGAGGDPPVASSVGVVCCAAADPRSLADLIDEADRLMYEEKRRKRGGRAGG